LKYNSGLEGGLFTNKTRRKTSLFKSKNYKRLHSFLSKQDILLPYAVYFLFLTQTILV
jgi:hypothetical protein